MPPPRRPGYNDVRPVEDIITDDECGELVAWLDRTPPDLEDRAVQAKMAALYVDRVEAISIQQSRETSVDKRKAEYMASAAWTIGVKDKIAKEASFDRLKHEISIAQRKIELYRSLKANERSRNEMERFQPRPRDDRSGRDDQGEQR